MPRKLRGIFIFKSFEKSLLKNVSKILLNKVFTYLCHPEKMGSSFIVVTLGIKIDIFQFIKWHN
jgi:hypothetical protein